MCGAADLPTGVTHERIAWPFDDHRAGAALAEAAAELRTAQLEVVAEHVEQRRRRIDVDGVRPPVDLQCQHDHVRYLRARQSGTSVLPIAEGSAAWPSYAGCQRCHVVCR